MEKTYKIAPLTSLALLVSIFGFIFLLAPSSASAHQPRIVNSDTTQVMDPEISKAYYSTLSGAPHIYTIDSKEDFDLYVGILVPETKSSKTDVTAEVFKTENKQDKLLATLGGNNAQWKSFFEPFGQSNYLDGGEYKIRALAGVYTIVVSSSNNDSKYSLAVGEIEAFDGKEGMNALSLIPELKKDFFEESPITFIKSPFGWGLIVVMYIFAFIVGFIYRAILKKFAKGSTLPVDASSNRGRGAPQNIGKPDRLIRLIIGVILLVWAITTTWSPILIFFSGFALFESIFSWCALYQLIGKSTCEVK
jgi:hypothetical protein